MELSSRHSLDQCQKFRDKNVRDRKELLKHNLCNVWLKANHIAKTVDYRGHVPSKDVAGDIIPYYTGSGKNKEIVIVMPTISGIHTTDCTAKSLKEELTDASKVRTRARQDCSLKYVYFLHSLVPKDNQKSDEKGNQVARSGEV